MMEPYKFQTKEWTAPVIEKIPKWTAITKKEKVLLTDRKKDQWEFRPERIQEIPSPFSANQDFDFTQLDESGWKKAVVPSSLVMQGFDIENNTEYYYRSKVSIPDDYKKGRIFLQLEGVYSHCRVWVDGKYAGTHIGGFTAWNCEITDLIEKERDTICLIIGVTDVEGSTKGTWNEQGEMISDSAWASYYAHHNVGGILRDITLFVLPESHFTRTYLDTVLEAPYKEALLCARMEAEVTGGKTSVKLELLDEYGQMIAAEENDLEESFREEKQEEIRTLNCPEEWKQSHPEAFANDQAFLGRYLYRKRCVCGKLYACKIELPVSNPKLWDAEHPNLYTVRLTLSVDRAPVQVNEYRIGFRQITYGGNDPMTKNRVLINGKEIKLRGVCRHDVSWKYGRSMSKEELQHEILSYKKNNINHLRTSHYPASDTLLELCDEYGIYVELENSACFKGANGFEIYNEPQEFIQTFAEMMEYSRNHSSVLIWSLANESGFEKTYGFRKEYQYAKEADPTRPVIFSYPETVTSSPVPYDIFSKHYADIAKDVLGKEELPMLHDEFAHIPCYNLESLCKENSSRIIWGESIRAGWEKIMQTDGALGCALWGAMDEVFCLPENTKQRHQCHSKGKSAGYGEWGAILDQYGREKPEAYLTKKAFSPIRLKEEACSFGEELILPVKNWFDHTNLNELEVVCRTAENVILYRGNIREDIPPHLEGTIRVPLDTKEVSEIFVEFWQNSYQVDCFLLKKEGYEKEEKNNVAEEGKLIGKLEIEDGSFVLYGENKKKLISGIRLFADQMPSLLGEKCTEVQLQQGEGTFVVEQQYDNGLISVITGGFYEGKLELSIETSGNDSCLEQYDSFGAELVLEQPAERIFWE
ncbi:MAG: glycoside hydrolase family 2 TIM barrel-domain containing protein, partial [Lachnospiraceae bacterium]|nr:glycoside hydrolase family 2 TIM barrel-domain containing protein [Lachnospiraceae bacterium]